MRKLEKATFVTDFRNTPMTDCVFSSSPAERMSRSPTALSKTEFDRDRSQIIGVSGRFPWIELNHPGAYRIRRRFLARTKGRYHSRKTGRAIWWESFLESGCCLLLERDATVTDFVSQPFCLHYLWKQKPHRYTPDFLVKKLGTEANIVLEVKPKKKQKEAEFYEPLPQILSALSEFNLSLQVVDEDAIGSQTYQSNLRLLNRYSGYLVTAEEIEQIKAMMESNPDLSISELCRLSCAIHQILQKIYRLIWDDEISADLNRPIGHITRISLTQ